MVGPNLGWGKGWCWSWGHHSEKTENPERNKQGSCLIKCKAQIWLLAEKGFPEEVAFQLSLKHASYGIVYECNSGVRNRPDLLGSGSLGGGWETGKSGVLGKLKETGAGKVEGWSKGTREVGAEGDHALGLEGRGK